MIKLKNKAPISVVTPALNEADNITAYFQALKYQTVLPAEIIIVDHNSTDDTFYLASSFIPTFNKLGVKLVVLQEKTPGIANARNTGWFRASQPIIASTDMDCRPHPNWIQVINTYFKTHPKTAAVTGKVMFNSQAPALIRLAAQLNWYKLLFYASKLISGFPHFTTANSAVKKTAFLKVGGFDTKIDSINGLDDIEIASRLSLEHDIKYCSDMVVTTSFRRYSPMTNGLRIAVKRGQRYRQIRKQFTTLKAD